MKNLFLIISCFVSSLGLAQVEWSYNELIYKADSFYQEKDYLSAKHYYEKVLELVSDDKWAKDKLEICDIYYKKFKENLQYCHCDSIIPKAPVYLMREKKDFSDIPVGYVQLYNENNQVTYCGYFFEGKFLDGLKFYYDSFPQFNNLIFVSHTNRFLNGESIDACQQIPFTDIVIVNQWHDVYGQMWRQTNSPFQPKPNYYILKTYKRNMVGQVYEYHYNCVGMVDTIAYHYMEKYKYDTLGSQIEIVKSNGSADSTKISFVYSEKNNLLQRNVIEYSNDKITTRHYGYTMDNEGKVEEYLFDIVETKKN